MKERWKRPKKGTWSPKKIKKNKKNKDKKQPVKEKTEVKRGEKLIKQEEEEKERDCSILLPESSPRYTRSYPS